MKLSNIFLGSNLLLYLSSILGIYLLCKLFLNNKKNSFLIILIFFIFSNNYMFQKYFEPLWLIIFFLVLDLDFVKKFLRNNFQIFNVLLFFLIYSITALINSFNLISINIFGRYKSYYGEVAEWLKAHAWKACKRETVSRVRDPSLSAIFL